MNRESDVSENSQPEGSHVHWPQGLMGGGTEDLAGVHRMKGKRRGRSSNWDVRMPNDSYVRSEGVTLEEMRRDGAV